MKAGRRIFERPAFSLALAAGLVVTTAGLVALGYRATQEWERSALLQLERQTDLMLVLLASALNRDMKGAQVSVLLPIEASGLAADPPFDFRDIVARAFARFPYPEAFFVWRADGGREAGVAYAFNRVERRSPWSGDGTQGPDPVVTRLNPPGLGALLDSVRAHAAERKRFTVFECDLGEGRYQVVAQLFHDASVRGGLAGVAGFVVNLDWIRARYFGDLIQEVSRLGGGGEAIALMILDDRGRTVATTGMIERGAPVRERRFPLLFFDPAMRSGLATRLPSVPEWTARVGAASASPVLAVRRGASRTLLLLALAASATVVGLLLTVRALRLQAELAMMRSEFVSTVTHELKSPLALIRLVGDTIALRRYTSTNAIEDYGRLLSQETKRLSRLIDNLLMYARASDAEHSYSFEALDTADLVEESLNHFRPRLAELDFEVDVAVPLDVPQIRADRVAMLHVLDNVIDNAIKYSGERKRLSVRAEPREGTLSLTISDQGHGIPEAEIPRVFEKFYRGREANGEGSGLGLAIVRRIVTDHRGRVKIHSRAGEGTAVTLLLPAVAA